jgi:type VI secretion system protein ImpL
LATALGVVVPVYLLVTQCDRISGMVRFFEGFPEAVRDQVWGGLNDERSAGPAAAAFLERVCSRAYRQLRELRLTLLGESEADQLHPEAFLFPEEFRALEEPLRNLLGTVFEDNPYREPAFCRGLYFCSARQEGTPVSRFLPDLGLQGEQLTTAATGQSWFLKEFFSAVLARDRALVSPTSKAIGWSRLTRNVGLSVWVVVCILLGALLSVAFVNLLRSFFLLNSGRYPDLVELLRLGPRSREGIRIERSILATLRARSVVTQLFDIVVGLTKIGVRF